VWVGVFLFCLGWGDVAFFVLFLNESQYFGTQFCGVKYKFPIFYYAETQYGMKNLRAMHLKW